MSNNDLKKAIKGIVKDFEDAAIAYDGKSSIPECVPMPTGFLGLDAALGIGGLPSGRWIELWGPASAGKTTLALQILAAGQAKGESVAFLDVEHSLDETYARKLGFEDKPDAVIIRPKDGEDGFEMLRRLLVAGVNRIVIDSMAALLTKAETEQMRKKGFQATPQPGTQARLLAHASKLLNPVLSERNAFVLYTNQTRVNMEPFGARETQPGGHAVKFYESVRMRLSRDGSKPAENGYWTTVRIAKNKYSPDGITWSGRMVYGTGFDATLDALQIAVERGIVERRGNWYVHEGQQLGMGLEKAADVLRGDPETMKAILAGLVAK